MVERSLSMREVRGSIPRISIVFPDFSPFPFWEQNEEFTSPPSLFSIVQAACSVLISIIMHIIFFSPQTFGNTILYSVYNKLKTKKIILSCTFSGGMHGTLLIIILFHYKSCFPPFVHLPSFSRENNAVYQQQKKGKIMLTRALFSQDVENWEGKKNLKDNKSKKKEWTIVISIIRVS